MDQNEAEDRLMAAARRLDVFDLAYEYGTESMQWESTEAASFPRKGIATRLLSFFYRGGLAALETVRSRGGSIAQDSTIFVAVSPNEVHSVEPVAARIPGSVLVGAAASAGRGFPLASAYRQSLRFLPALVRQMSGTVGFRRKSFAYNFDGYLLSYGLYVAMRRWFREIRPKAVVSCNHLHVVHRTIVKAARDEGIPTVYAQHASVPPRMPPLVFDVALLDGADAAGKYAAAGASDAAVYLVGMAKSDSYINRAIEKNTVAVVGVCTNNLDPIDRARDMCVAVRKELPDISLVLRPHPTDRRSAEWRRLAEDTGLDLSDARKVHPFQFLQSVDVLIAGDSNIHLEAALMDVLPIYHDFSGTAEDWYGFLRNGLVEYARTPEDVCEIIRREKLHKSRVRPRAKQYCVTVGTRYQGRSAELAASIIAAVGTNMIDAKPDPEIWRTLADFPFLTYEPK